VRNRLKTRDIGLELDKAAKDFLIEKGYNPDFGARPLRRAISRSIEDPLAEALLGGEYKSHEKVVITHKEGAENLSFSSEPMPKDEDGKDGKDNGNGGGGGDQPSAGPKGPKEASATAS
jgi:ATP-dependent Clp protease ATP-binding subunit ClpC